MDEKNLITLIEELKDVKCCLKQKNGDMLVGIIGNLYYNTKSYKMGVEFYDDKNTGCVFLLSMIESLTKVD